jgi:hypothetical protein
VALRHLPQAQDIPRRQRRQATPDQATRTSPRPRLRQMSELEGRPGGSPHPLQPTHRGVLRLAVCTGLALSASSTNRPNRASPYVRAKDGLLQSEGSTDGTC